MSIHVAISNWLNERDDKRPKIDKLMDAVVKVTGITEEAIRGRDRYTDIVLARQLFCYVAVTYLEWNKTNLGRHLGTDHTTIMHRVNGFKQSLKQDFRESNRKLKEVLKILRINYE